MPELPPGCLVDADDLDLFPDPSSNFEFQVDQGAFLEAEGMKRCASSPGTGKKTTYHLTRALPQVKPPPKTGRQTRWPSWMLPSLTASSKAMAQEAEEMFPYL